MYNKQPYRGRIMNQTIHTNVDFARAVAVLWGSIEQEKKESISHYEDNLPKKEEVKLDPIHSISSTNY